MGFVLAELTSNRDVEISQLVEVRGQLLELWKQDYLMLDEYPPASHVRLLLEIGDDKGAGVFDDAEAESFQEALENLANEMEAEGEASGQAIF